MGVAPVHDVLSARERRLGDPVSRWLAAATACIVVAFAIVNAISAVRLHRIDASARELSDEIAPRIEHLTVARGLLHELARAVRAGAAQDADPAPLVALRDELRRWPATREAPPQIVAAVAPGLDASGRLAAIERADVAIEKEMHELAARSRQLGDAVAVQRRAVADVAVGVQSLAAFMAIAAIAMAWIAGHQQTRLARARTLMEQHERHVAVARAGELEMFASRAAHDLKAPLSAILLYLKSSGTQPLGAEATELIEQTVSGAIEIVDAILDYARAAGPPDESTAEVAEVVGHLMQGSVRQWIAASGGQVRVEVSVEPDLVAGCARGALRSILANLLRNAFEHAVPAGARRIELRARAHGDRLRVEVGDDGPGVPPELRARIFEPYVRGESPRRGLGLGLATIKRFAEGCGGAIGLADVERGATFWVELPHAT